MSKEKIAITLDEQSIDELDRLVREKVFPNRSQAVQEAVTEKLERLSKNRLAQESAKLNRVYEQQMADEDIQQDTAEWPEY
ncbi:MAG: ribbon-helix-helix protein, CopG family [Dehalococcoidales bacterium]|nr:ribbon-helix-helix protein, CopG family [Dehalococcoidales bacterium]